MREVDVARPVVALLRDEGFEVYQEVEARFPTSTRGFVTRATGVADIVATRGPLLIVVEAKTALTFDVIGQAVRWLPIAHQVYVAVPGLNAGSVHPIAKDLLTSLGVGCFTVNRHLGSAVRSLDASTRARADVVGLRGWLREEQRDFSEAGNAGGHRWSRFKDTCRKLLAYVREHPGCHLKDAVEKVPNHYRTATSARTSLVHWIERGKVPGIVAVRDARHILLWPAPERTGRRR